MAATRGFSTWAGEAAWGGVVFTGKALIEWRLGLAPVGTRRTGLGILWGFTLYSEWCSAT